MPALYRQDLVMEENLWPLVGLAADEGPGPQAEVIRGFKMGP